MCVSCEGTTPHLLQGSAGIGTHAVQLIDEGEEGDVVTLHLPVDCHGLTLDPSHRTQNQYGPVQHAQRSLHFNGEVHMTCMTDENMTPTNPLQVIMFRLLLLKDGIKGVDETHSCSFPDPNEHKLDSQTSLFPTAPC